MTSRHGSPASSTSANAPIVSVVIPTRDRRELVVTELQALAEQTLDSDRYEVIVVVDGSADGTLEAMEAFHAPFPMRAIWQAGAGRAAARNAGIGAAAGGIIVFLDDDMLPTPGLLTAHIRAHPSGARRAVLGPAPIQLGADASVVTRYVGTKFNRHLAQLAAGAPIGFRELYTGNLSIRRDVLADVGLFDLDFTIYGNEDSELAIRLLAAGVEFLYAPDAVAYQRYTKGFAALARDNVEKGRTAVILARKHPQAASELRLSARSSRKLRWVRASLLLLSRAWRGTPRMVTLAVNGLARVLPALALRTYPVALDYFYWSGASAELRRQGVARSRDTVPSADPG